MAIRFVSPNEEVGRKRKAHHKSKRGCGNCKIRRVKCDETKPKCKRCTTYGVACNYGVPSSDLQLMADGVLSVEFPLEMPLSINHQLLDNINTQLRQSAVDQCSQHIPYQLNSRDLETLHRFHNRTILSLGTAYTRQMYHDAITTLAYSHPHLMHAVLTYTMMHDRAQAVAMPPKQSASEAFHWYQSTRLFTAALANPETAGDKDALWPTAAMLGAITFMFSCLTVTKAEDAWPLKKSSSNDMDWIDMSDGKKEVWKITNPTRSDSMWNKAAHNQDDIMAFLTRDLTMIERAALPTEFLCLFQIDAHTNSQNNPYWTTIVYLAHLNTIECTQANLLQFLTFISHIDPGYKALLTQKDARAMVLLAYWYARLCTFRRWWMQRRAVFECQAICIYLERYHSHEPYMVDVIQMPKAISIKAGQNFNAE